MSREKWVPFPDVTEHTDGQITMGHAGLPVGLDPERMELNVHALRSGAIGWGGFESVELGAYSGDSDQWQMGGNVDGSGVGVASGAASVSKAESSKHDTKSDDFKNYFDIRNGSLGIHWNITALNQRLETHQQYDPKIRARQIDKAITASAIKGVIAHNTSEMVSEAPLAASVTKLLILDGLMFFGPLAYAWLNRYPTLGSIFIGSRMLITQIGLPAIINIKTSDMEDFPTRSERIPDLFMYTVRPTRAAMGAGRLTSSRLVRAV